MALMQPLIHVANLKDLQQHFPGESEIWAVDVTRQHLHRIRKSKKTLSTPISTSRFGFSNTEGSFCTPLGAHTVYKVVGENAEIGQPFKNRKPQGPPLKSFIGGKGDAILTRIIWLDGLVPDYNDKSRSRYIYIHGTHQEEKLGTPASQGCIRMGNILLAEWVKSLSGQKPMVWIGTIENFSDSS